MSDLKLLIAGRVKDRRQRLGVSQAAVAKVLGLHRVSVTEVEAGRRNLTALEAVKLAEFFGCSIDELLLSAGKEKI